MPYQKEPPLPKGAKGGRGGRAENVRWGFDLAGGKANYGRVEELGAAYRRLMAEDGGGAEGDVSYGDEGDEALYGGGVEEVWAGPEIRDEKGRPLRVRVLSPYSGTRQTFGAVREMPVRIGEETAFAADDPLVEEAVAAVLERVPEIVHARREKLSQEHIDLLVDAYLASAPTASARHSIELDNARERARFREEFPCYTSRELAELAGHGAGNVSATATRWKKARRIIGLPWKDGDLYPAFQFSEGRPRPVIARLIAALPGRMTPWQTAFWLTSSNSWLGGAAPVDRLGDEPALLAAAARESEALGG